MDDNEMLCSLCWNRLTATNVINDYPKHICLIKTAINNEFSAFCASQHISHNNVRMLTSLTTFFIIFGLLKSSTMTSPETRSGRFRVSSSDAWWSSDFFARWLSVISDTWQCCRRFRWSADPLHDSVDQRTTYIGTAHTCTCITRLEPIHWRPHQWWPQTMTMTAIGWTMTATNHDRRHECKLGSYWASFLWPSLLWFVATIFEANIAVSITDHCVAIIVEPP